MGRQASLIPKKEGASPQGRPGWPSLMTPLHSHTPVQSFLGSGPHSVFLPQVHPA